MEFIVNSFSVLPQDPEILYSALDLESHGKIPRLRAIGIKDGKIFIRTRTGGGNRGQYSSFHEAMRKHPNYLEDEDDSFDPTCCRTFFSVPNASKSQIDQLLAEHSQK